MYLLDTNVVSELMRPNPNEAVLTWAAKLETRDIFLSAISVAEIEYGIAVLPDGVRKSNLSQGFRAILEAFFTDKILNFDQRAAQFYAPILAYRRSIGRPMSQLDCQIAAIAQTHKATLVTRNVRDFDGTSANLLNPFG